MSVLNCYIGPSHALVSVDTRTIDVAGAPAHMQKLMPLPVLNAAIAFRGHNLFSIMVAAEIYASGFELEELREAMPSMLSKVHRSALTIAQDRGIANIDYLRGKHEVVLVGWSKKKGCMIGWQYQNDPSKEGFAAQAIEDGECYKAPFDPDHPDGIAEMPCSTVDEMIELARKQKAMIERHYPGNIGTPGGNLIVARIDALGMNIFTVCDLG